MNEKNKNEWGDPFKTQTLSPAIDNLFFFFLKQWEYCPGDWLDVQTILSLICIFLPDGPQNDSELCPYGPETEKRERRHPANYNGTHWGQSSPLYNLNNCQPQIKYGRRIRSDIMDALYGSIYWICPRSRFTSHWRTLSDMIIGFPQRSRGKTGQYFWLCYFLQCIRFFTYIFIWTYLHFYSGCSSTLL